MDANLPVDVEAKLLYLEKCRAASNGWKKEADKIKTEIDQAIAQNSTFVKDPDNLQPEILNGLAGKTSFEYRPVITEKVDLEYLKTIYPDVYKACLKRRVSFTLVLLQTNEDQDA